MQENEWNLDKEIIEITEENSMTIPDVTNGNLRRTTNEVLIPNHIVWICLGGWWL